jgi:hypothetical protein
MDSILFNPFCHSFLTSFIPQKHVGFVLFFGTFFALIEIRVNCSSSNRVHPWKNQYLTALKEQETVQYLLYSEAGFINTFKANTSNIYF